jgi:ATP-dependent Clp protease ATP-binding subunit ClpC
MFERYDEHARRSIFFARAEASYFGSSRIDTEHLLLGILQEDFRLRKELPGRAIDQIRAEIERLTPSPRREIPTSVDMPLSTACKQALSFGAEEAERLGNEVINTGHLLLGSSPALCGRSAALSQCHRQIAWNQPFFSHP